MTGSTPLSLAVIVLTRNEEQNLPACLESVRGWCSELFVVDSGSTDGTVNLARAAGAVVATHPFETHAHQWHWALDALSIRADWVLALDADQRVSPELRQAIETTLAAPESVSRTSGYYVNRRQMFRGRWIRYGGYYPMPLLKLFRRSAVSVDLRERVDHHFTVAGRVARLTGDLIEDNANELAIFDWIAKHNRYARLQAEEELERARSGEPGGRLFGHRDERIRWAKARWRHLPLLVRPFLYFSYRYVIRFGFLDGRNGFVFHFMQALWYRLLVDVNRQELDEAARRRLPGS